MKLYYCNAEPANRKFCYVSSYISQFYGPLARGFSVASLLQEFEVNRLEIEIDEGEGGLELPDLVGTPINCLILRNRVAEDIIEHFEMGQYETVQTSLINEKKRVHSTDYTVINPLGFVDVLDPTRSDLVDDLGLKVVQIFGKFAIKKSAIPADRDIFRVQGLPLGYMFSERLVDFIHQQGYTNFTFADVVLS